MLILGKNVFGSIVLSDAVNCIRMIISREVFFLICAMNILGRNSCNRNDADALIFT